MNVKEAITFPLNSRRDTLRLARELAIGLCAGDLVVLSGELGVGKTFLARGMCRAMGLPQHIRVTSPTFTLIHELDTHPPALHVDLYRLESSLDVQNLGLLSRRDEGKVLLVEWGEPWISELGGDALIIALSGYPRGARLTSSGARSAKMLAHLKESRQEEKSINNSSIDQ